MLAGFAEAAFTPPAGGNMPGGFEPEVAKDGSFGQLLANAAAFTAGGEDVILVSADVLSFKADFVEALRARISAETGVAPKHILIAAIHTHTGPAVEYQLWLCPPEPETAARTGDAIVKAAVAAYRNRAEAKLGTLHFEEDRFNFNRDILMKDGKIKMNPSMKKRDQMVRHAGKVDYSVDVMRVDDAAGSVKCFIVNYANHPDCHARDKTHYSADFIGFMRRALKFRYGKDVTVLFFNGTAGDINCIDFMEGKSDWFYNSSHVGPQVIGSSLAKDIMDRNDEFVTDVTDPVIAVSDEYVVTSRRHATEADKAWAAEAIKDPNARDDVRAFATEYLQPDDSPDTDELEVQVIRLGPWSIVGLPSEIFTEIGLTIKAVSPYNRTLVFELANGTHGYIAPAYRFENPCYELTFSKYNSYTGPETAEKLIQASARMLREHFYRES